MTLYQILLPLLIIASAYQNNTAVSAEWLNTVTRQPNWITESNQVYAFYGISVSTAGDVNGDGYSDVIVGAYQYDNGEDGEGRAYAYYGSAIGLDTIPDWTVESDQPNARFGIWVSSAGDVNGDGYSDVIVGAYQYDNGEEDEGRAYAYYGSAIGLDTIPDWTAECDDAYAHFGSCVSTAGDVNGDGYSDVIIGAPFYGSMDEGRAFVYYGSLSGLSATPDWTVGLSQTASRFGNAVSTAGDVNGDGYSDVIVAAYYYDNGQNNEGCVFVYYGDSSGLSLTHDWFAESNQSGARFGISVSLAGDVNGDSYSDIIVGARHYDHGEPDEGMAFVYHGGAAGLDTIPAWTAESNQAGAYFGRSVSTAGDVNGDGFSDVIIGAQTYDNGEENEGRAFAYQGNATGLDTVPVWTAESDQPAAYFSRSVFTAGDVNGDGYSDVIVGAYYYDNGELNEGRAYVYHGNLVGVEEEKASVKKYDLGPTIFSGPLVLPEGKECKVFDITGRGVMPDKIKPGIYFIKVDGKITGKVVKIR
jgi:hypothetical protein